MVELLVVERIAHGWKISMVYLCISYMIMLGIYCNGDKMGYHDYHGYFMGFNEDFYWILW